MQPLNPSHGMMLYLVVVILGMLVPIQTAANARLRMRVQSVWVATLLSFSVSTLALLVASVAAGETLLPGEEQSAVAPWWSWGGGVIALLTITAYIYLFRALGTLQATILPIVGQLVFSLLIDHFGLFHAAWVALTPARMLAVCLLLAGTALAVGRAASRGADENAPGRSALRTVALQMLGIVTGCLLACMGAIYGALGKALGSATQAALCSFAIATAVMLLCCSLVGIAGRVRFAFVGRNPWWMWLGGVVGAVAVFGNAWIIPQIGAGAFFMLLLIGQMWLSVCMEWLGWMGALRRRITCMQCLGLLLMLLGVAIIRL